jgi:glucan 1,3-beta-glucosidase
MPARVARQASTDDTEPTANLNSAQALAAFPDGYWLNDLSGNGRAAFNDNGAYKVFRNVKEYGAKGEQPMSSSPRAISLCYRTAV